jgi:hypothetical protein
LKRLPDATAGVLDAFDEIGEMIGNGNRSIDACGDNSRLGHGIKQAAKPSQGCFFGYNRANSRAVSRPIGVSQPTWELALKGS